MLIAVLVTFIICWTPFQCLTLYDVIREHDERVSAVVSPILYNFPLVAL